MGKWSMAWVSGAGRGKVEQGVGKWSRTWVSGAERG